MSFEGGRAAGAPEDSVLVREALRGNEAAFAQLMQRYRRPVLWKIHRILGRTAEDDDALQETFLRAFTALPRFKTSSAFGPWVMRIAANYCIDVLRRARRHRVHLVSQMGDAEKRRLDDAVAVDGPSDTPIHRAACEKLVETIVEELKPRYRAAIVLRDLEGREYAEVAGALGVSMINARVLVSRARKMIQQQFHCRSSRSIAYVS